MTDTVGVAGQGALIRRIRGHALAVVRVGVLLVCAAVFAAVVDDRLDRSAAAGPVRPLTGFELERDASYSAAVLEARAVVARDRRTRERPGATLERRIWGARVLLPSRDALGMLAFVQTGNGDHVILGYVRADASGAWRAVTEVELTDWPWGSYLPVPEPRAIPFRPATALRAAVGARPIKRTVAVPADRGRTLVCGEIGGPSPVEQMCVGVSDDRPDRPYVLGAQ